MKKHEMTHLDLERNLTHKRDTSLQNQIVTQKLSKTLNKKSNPRQRNLQKIPIMYKNIIRNWVCEMISNVFLEVTINHSSQKHSPELQIFTIISLLNNFSFTIY